jgi:hypothetical protein
MADSKVVRAAQAGGVSKGMPSKPSSPGSKGNGLKQAWADQTKRPSVLTDVSAAKKRVR